MNEYVFHISCTHNKAFHDLTRLNLDSPSNCITAITFNKYSRTKCILYSDPTLTATAEHKLIVPHLKFTQYIRVVAVCSMRKPTHPNSRTYFFPAFIFLASGCSWLVFVGRVCFRCCNCRSVYSWIQFFNSASVVTPSPSCMISGVRDRRWTRHELSTKFYEHIRQLTAREACVYMMGGVPRVCTLYLSRSSLINWQGLNSAATFHVVLIYIYYIHEIINNVTSLVAVRLHWIRTTYVERAAPKLIDVSVVNCKLQRTRKAFVLVACACVLRLTFPSIEIEPKIILRRIPSPLENPLRPGVDEYRMLCVILECNTLAYVWCGDWMRLRCGRFSTKSIWKHFRHKRKYIPCVRGLVIQRIRSNSARIRKRIIMLDAGSGNNRSSE